MTYLSTVTFRCLNEECDEALGIYEVFAQWTTEGAAPPYGPAGGLNHYLEPIEDPICPWCEEEGEPT